MVPTVRQLMPNSRQVEDLSMRWARQTTSFSPQNWSTAQFLNPLAGYAVLPLSYAVFTVRQSLERQRFGYPSESNEAFTAARSKNCAV